MLTHPPQFPIKLVGDPMVLNSMRSNTNMKFGLGLLRINLQAININLFLLYSFLLLTLLSLFSFTGNSGVGVR